jgi:hypothetical protein
MELCIMNLLHSNKLCASISVHVLQHLWQDVQDNWCEKWHTGNRLHHHDNGPVHFELSVQEFLANNGITLILHHLHPASPWLLLWQHFSEAQADNRGKEIFMISAQFKNNDSLCLQSSKQNMSGLTGLMYQVATGMHWRRYHRIVHKYCHWEKYCLETFWYTVRRPCSL